MMKIETFTNVWEAIEDTPEDVEEMTIRCRLMDEIVADVKNRKLKKPEAAKRYGVTSTRIGDLLVGDIDRFEISDLVRMLAHAGMHIELTVK
jgi:predicted XRE-type DNA-binding protein